eukprot:CAMPEP_0197682926 /NCGR_PEP_ID=MMETSP1338-20131121/97192_1 /TAXON_ID=43686 ORGANISM="Pelagodinium beii, Strain RCC1491" /NCGR_SAMPLE_ID=MMETSP1338 /ASSEMBLY_ACC=CAM_ASM_000754 /LENGTH=156 /DNA_ID=CAMNT_0043264443 /DNA_START=45 /DNA_END=512 /DNA_ORIENTATION=+
MARGLEKDTPVLAETEVEEKLQAKKLEFKEKRLQSLENKAEKDKGHEKPDITKKNFELQLRKHATQGVVRLFNAVRDYQSHSVTDAAAKATISSVPIKKRAKVLADTKTEKFKQSLEKATKGKEAKKGKAKVSEKPGAARKAREAAAAAPSDAGAV